MPGWIQLSGWRKTIEPASHKLFLNVSVKVLMKVCFFRIFLHGKRKFHIFYFLSCLYLHKGSIHELCHMLAFFQKIYRTEFQLKLWTEGKSFRMHVHEKKNLKKWNFFFFPIFICLFFTIGITYSFYAGRALKHSSFFFSFFSHLSFKSNFPSSYFYFCYSPSY